MAAGDDELEIARLQARVAALEAALARRSAMLRQLQQHVCLRDLVLIGRLDAGLPPLSRFANDPRLWLETLEPVSADVEEVMTDLWSSVAPAAPEAAPDRDDAR
jgi:hypothetical protein